jgi:hypothetical protein
VIRVLGAAAGCLVGVLGSAVFVLAVLCALAQPVAAADGCSAPQLGPVSPCADLDVSRFRDLRSDGPLASCLLARGFRTVDEAGSPWAAPAPAPADFAACGSA